MIHYHAGLGDLFLNLLLESPSHRLSYPSLDYVWIGSDVIIS